MVEWVVVQEVMLLFLKTSSLQEIFVFEQMVLMVFWSLVFVFENLVCKVVIVNSLQQWV